MIPTLNDYYIMKNSSIFKNMEEFEKTWMQRYPFPGYDCESLLHHWSRVWEYPFVYAQKPTGKILDVGCGWSFFPAFLKEINPELDIHISDNDPKIVDWHNVPYARAYLTLEALREDYAYDGFIVVDGPEVNSTVH